METDQEMQLKRRRLNFDIETKIMFGILVLLFFFSTYKYTIIFLLFWIFIYLFGFFLTSIGMEIDLIKLEDCEIYYQEYTGDYSKLFNRLKEYNKIKKKLKLKSSEYSPFGVFYDNPFNVADLSKCRAVVGIIRHPHKFISITDKQTNNIEQKVQKNADLIDKEVKDY